ncbi:synaptonemal complex protein 2-like isoform X2 [Orbicella faveolata]|uniref:synaptonemal complex protein 2-like isoform X2 n=1 Tax=Orbicella faveolata TaxID=48498 RepID=UPI0009E20798|nr:synaptonemal complex protein 2-like isoform X2 [Orbicella faveolata]
MEKRLEDNFSDICHELLQNPKEGSELKSGRINQLSQSFKNITDAIGDLSETGNSTLEQLFSLDLHLIIRFIFNTLVDHDVYKTDAVESLLSLLLFLRTICEKSWSGKDKLVSIVPVLLHDIIVNVERGIPLRIEAVKLTNMILGDVVNDEVDSTDVVSLAFKELEDNMEHLIGTAGDFELQAGMVELIFRLIPGDTRHKKAREYFSCDLVSSAFCDITSPEFEAGCRNFLNTLNQSQKENQSVASIPCYSASFGKTEVGIIIFCVLFSPNSEGWSTIKVSIFGKLLQVCISLGI